MAEIFNFRSAFNGFRREDVVHYIEYLNAKHTAEVNQLNSEIAFLRQQLERAQAGVPAETAASKSPSPSAHRSSVQPYHSCCEWCR